MTDLKQASVRGVAWNLVQNLVGRLLGLVVVAVLGRLLARESFGEVAVALAIREVAEQITGLGFAEFITQRETLDDDHLDAAFWLNLTLAVVACATLALSAGAVAELFDAPGLAPIIRWLSLSLVVRALAVVPTQLLQRRFQFRTLSVRSLIAIAVGGCTGIIGAFSGLGVFAILLQMLVADAVSTAILWGATEWRPRARFDRERARDLTRFGAPVLAATLLNLVSRKLDALIVGAKLRMDPLGTYSMAQRPFQIAQQVLNKSGDAVALSALSRLADDAHRRRAAVYRAVEITAALCFPLYTLLAICADPLVVAMFGSKWADSGPVLTMFALSGLPISLSYLHAPAIKSSGNTRLYLVVHIVLVCVYLPLLFMLVGGGPTAAASAYLISCCLIAPVEVWLVHIALGISIRDYVVSLWGPSFATAIMSATLLGIARVFQGLPIALQPFVIGIAGLAVYVVALRLVATRTYNLCVNVTRSLIDKPTPSPT